MLPATDMTMIDDISRSNNIDEVIVRGKKYYCNTSGNLYLSQSPMSMFIWEDVGLLQRTQAFLRNKLVPKMNLNYVNIPMYTTLIKHGKTYHACPNYKGNEWHNWACVEISERKNTPCASCSNS